MSLQDIMRRSRQSAEERKAAEEQVPANKKKKCAKKKKQGIIGPGRDGRVVRKITGTVRGLDWDIGSDPVEFFGRTNTLADSAKNKNKMRILATFKTSNDRRTRIARMLRDTHDGSLISGMASADVSGQPSGGFAPRTVSDFKIGCMECIGRWRDAMPADIWSVLQSCIISGEFVFEKGGRIQRKTKLEMIRFGLDIIALQQGEFDLEQLNERWPEYQIWKQAEKLKPFVHLGRVLKRKRIIGSGSV